MSDESSEYSLDKELNRILYGLQGNLPMIGHDEMLAIVNAANAAIERMELWIRDNPSRKHQAYANAACKQLYMTVVTSWGLTIEGFNTQEHLNALAQLCQSCYIIGYMQAEEDLRDSSPKIKE